MPKRSDICPYCESDKLELRQNNRKTSLYCASCGRFIHYVTTSAELKRRYEAMELSGLSGHMGYKTFRRLRRNTLIHCSECDCLLFSSRDGNPPGQFNLLNASFCPKCGVEFVDEQKMLSTDK